MKLHELQELYRRGALTSRDVYEMAFGPKGSKPDTDPAPPCRHWRMQCDKREEPAPADNPDSAKEP